jgi:hypothetical protein
VSIEAALDEAAERGERASLDDLGGPAAILGREIGIARGPHAVPVLQAVLDALGEGGDPDGRAGLETFVVACARERHAEAYVTAAIVPLIAEARQLAPRTRDACFRAFVMRINDRKDDPASRWAAMDGALRMALEEGVPSRRHQLLGEMLSVESDDDEYFLRHAAKITGVAYSHWRDPDLPKRLEQMLPVEEAADEAAYELGMACVARALDAEDRTSAESGFSEARRWFADSLNSRPDRTDAALYANALDVLSGFSKGASGSDLARYGDELARLSLAHRAFHQDEDDPPWLGARWGEMCQWESLAIQLGDAATGLSTGDPFDTERAATLVHERILAAYVAGRSALGRDRRGGIEAVLRPRIEAKFMRRKSLLVSLDTWLDVEGAASPWADTARELRITVRERLRGNDLGNGSRMSGTTFSPAS